MPQRLSETDEKSGGPERGRFCLQREVLLEIADEDLPVAQVLADLVVRGRVAQIYVRLDEEAFAVVADVGAGKALSLVPSVQRLLGRRRGHGPAGSELNL